MRTFRPATATRTRRLRGAPPRRAQNAAPPCVPDAAPLIIYVAGSFKHKHGVRLLGRELTALGCRLLDWTEKATPPPGLTPQERRAWMDTDRAGGQVFAFCRDACLKADLVIYYGASGQDAGVEVGLAAGAGVPVLGIRGPLEAPGLMLHGAGTAWVDSVEEALALVAQLASLVRSPGAQSSPAHAPATPAGTSAPLRRLTEAVLAHRGLRAQNAPA